MKKIALTGLTFIAFASALSAVFAGCGSEVDAPLGTDDGAADSLGAGDGLGPGDGNPAPRDGAGQDGAPQDGALQDRTFPDGTFPDGNLPDGFVCKAVGDSCASSVECCTVNCDPVAQKCAMPIGPPCTPAGGACAAGTDCCTSRCNAGTCAGTQCVGDRQACADSSECCSGTCLVGPTGGTCTPLNPTCSTTGNPCAADGDCCSRLCRGLICADSSFCTQAGDVCSDSAQCCTGACNKAPGATLGICAPPPSGGCTPSGVLCVSTGANCGGDCCSRSCHVFAPSGLSVCQPFSGCRGTGEICLNHVDCCGSATLPDGTLARVECTRKPGDLVARCDNGNRCSPAGAVCRLATNSCNATDRCCSGTVQQNPLRCQQDALGVPRCTANPAVDCAISPPPPPGTACASSADCCGNPCTPGPTGALECAGTNCIPSMGACTTHADCCAGTPCVFPSGPGSGVCTPPPVPSVDAGGPDAGGPDAVAPPGCALYGQVCAVSADCCNSIPCTSGRCRNP